MDTIISRREQHRAEHNLQQLPALLQRIYSHRRITDLAELDKSLPSLPPFHDLKSIDKAASVIADHICQQQRVTIIGDFDADGATSTALAVSALQTFGAKQVNFLVPNRFEYGYGLTPEIVEVAQQQQKPALIITVDNGIASLSGVEKAKEYGIAVVITDHHLPGDELPQADAIVNPNQPGDKFISKNLAGVGVIFYVMSAVRQMLRERNWFDQQNLPEPPMTQFLDLVALGTVADVVPLDRLNRLLVHQGLLRIRAEKCRPGILALLEVAKRSASRLIAADLGFAVGPRLNAAGRLNDMSHGIACLLTTDINQARQLAFDLDQLNLERRSLESEMQQDALQALNDIHLRNDNDLPMALAIYDEHWHQGVIGILASRIKDKYHRPVIAFAKANEHELKGSARSVNGLNIRDILDAITKKHPQMITKFGGHAMAAGLMISRQQLKAFQQAFAKEVSLHLTREQLRGEIFTDGELAPQEFTLATAQLIRDAGPWGQGFPEPMFDGKFHLIEQRLVGMRHLKMTLQGGENILLDAIAFNVDVERWPNERIKQVHLAYRLDINEYQGRQNLQLLVEHLAAVGD